MKATPQKDAVPGLRIEAVQPLYAGELTSALTQINHHSELVNTQANPEVLDSVPYVNIDGIGVYRISGPLLTSGSWYSRALGYSAYDDIRADLTKMVSDPGIKEILLHMGTPGGSVFGVTDAAETIARVNSVKPVYVYSAKNVASGGYWLAANCKELIGSPESEWGSVGVIVTHFSYEKQLEDAGVSVTVLRSADFKAVGGPYKDLTDKEVEHIKSQVDQYNDLFQEHIRSKRPGVRLTSMRGETYIGDEALRVGLIDAVMSYDQTINYIKSKRTETQTQGAFSMKFTAVELKTALDAGKTLADLGITEAERDEILATPAAPPSADTEVDKLKADLAAAEALLAESEAKVQDLAGKLEASEAEVASLKENQKPNVNAELKKIVCELTDNRRVALGMQKIDMAEFSVDTVLVEYAAVTKAYEKAFVEGGALTKKTETKATSLAGDSIEAGHLQAARF